MSFDVASPVDAKLFFFTTVSSISSSFRFIIFDHAHAHPFELSVRCRPRRRATTTSDFFTGRRTTRARAIPRPARAFRTGYKARTRLADRGEPRLARRGQLTADSSRVYWMLQAWPWISCFRERTIRREPTHYIEEKQYGVSNENWDFFALKL